ncbi:MAG: glucose-6-phosphate isomerase, partial [Gammaproteobacteria bacterium]
ASIDSMLSKLNPQKTLVIISSKSFTTLETINNANSLIGWLKQQNNNNNNYFNQIIAVTSNFDKAINFGISPKNIFDFSDAIGGRYSIWSAVGLPVIIKIGFDNFKKFLQGAYLVDEHFKNRNFIDNIPVIMGLISVWNINFMQYKSLAVIPYLDALNNFPEYLQQLSMESNGKSVDLQNQQLDYDTVEIIFGGAGSNVQHSFMQMLHQGTQIVPVDFIVSAINQQFLFANCIAQSQALMEGARNLDLFKQCRGNRPNSILLFPELTPEILGSLIALYEHKVFVQSVMWNINPFDQWGVELGKNLANQILSQMKNNICQIGKSKEISSSILGLIEAYSKFNYELIS